MRNFVDQVNKFIKKVKRDGFISAFKKACVRFNAEYLAPFNIFKNIKFLKNFLLIIMKFIYIIIMKWKKILQGNY